MTTDISDNHVEFNFVSGLSDDENLQKKNHVYSKEERLLIDKYREKYQAATSPSQRKMIAKLKIFPELFNYWKGKGKVYNNEETERKTKVRSSLI